ncbi:MAG: tetratricopeptide repeat protein, partial [Verrucomicrobiota bacterium]|nr:tetratricopeptide repeat protein [Verrucomicrobiota bacterium]
FEEAIKQFDVFLQKYPKSEDVESVNYGRALASYQIQKYDDAVAGLRGNLQRFSKSESILDSQYLLALTLATQANAASSSAAALYDEAEKLLRDIVQKGTDVALANDAQFQIGEVIFNRASMSAKAARPTFYAKADAAYRAVVSKEQVIKAQEDRLARIVERIRAAGASKDVATVRRLQTLIGREQGKLAAIRTHADETVSAKIKIGVVFFVQERFDEARTMFSYVQQFADDAEQKKQIFYYVTLTYALQFISEKAVACYDEFQQNFRGDPIAENLPLTIGVMFLGPKLNQAETALKYFKESTEIYPHGKFSAETLTQQATALINLKQFDEALDTFKKFLETKPRRDLAAQAELGIATVYAQAGKIDDAIRAFKKVRETYTDLPQAAEAAFNIGGLALQKQDAKTAIVELNNFALKYPTSELLPGALLYLGVAKQTTGDKPGAIAAYKTLIEKYPADPNTESAYLQTASIYFGDQKIDEMAKVLREFIAKLPGSAKLFDAYHLIAQTQLTAGKVPEALATYKEFIDANPTNPQTATAMLTTSQLWLQYAQSQGRYLALNETQRAEWEEAIDNSLASAETLIAQFPDSPEVALALQNLLAVQRLNLGAKRITDEQIEEYFQKLAQDYDARPATKNKVLFTLASFVYEKDKAKAAEQMSAAYDPELQYAPADLDLYGGALIEQKKTDEARQVYEKLAADYPNPAGATGELAPPQIAQAQAISIYGIGRVLQAQRKIDEAGKQFDQLKKLYPSSPKIIEANFGIAQSLFQQKKYDEAAALLVQIIRAPTATAELRANSMLLNAKILEGKNNLEAAIDNYLKIPMFYESVQVAAADGLWKGGQLIEQQVGAMSDPAKKTTQLGKAIRAYKDLEDKYPGSPLAPKAKGRLAALQPGK